MKNILYTIILCLLSTNLLAEERYSCTVDEFVTETVGDSSDRSEYIEKNLKKKFLINVMDNQILITTLFNNQHSQSTYTIVSRDLVTTDAVNPLMEDIGLYDRFVIESNIIPPLSKKVKASIHNYSLTFINVWFLNCSSSL